MLTNYLAVGPSCNTEEFDTPILGTIIVCYIIFSELDMLGEHSAILHELLQILLVNFANILSQWKWPEAQYIVQVTKKNVENGEWKCYSIKFGFYISWPEKNSILREDFDWLLFDDYDFCTVACVPMVDFAGNFTTQSALWFLRDQVYSFWNEVL